MEKGKWIRLGNERFLTILDAAKSLNLSRAGLSMRLKRKGNWGTKLLHGKMRVVSETRIKAERSMERWTWRKE